MLISLGGSQEKMRWKKKQKQKTQKHAKASDLALFFSVVVLRQLMTPMRACKETNNIVYNYYGLLLETMKIYIIPWILLPSEKGLIIWKTFSSRWMSIFHSTGDQWGVMQVTVALNVVKQFFLFRITLIVIHSFNMNRINPHWYQYPENYAVCCNSDYIFPDRMFYTVRTALERRI